MEPKEINYEHVINSLANKLTDAEIESSKKDAVIITLTTELQELQKDNKNLKEQLKGNVKKK